MTARNFSTVMVKRATLLLAGTAMLSLGACGRDALEEIGGADLAKSASTALAIVTGQRPSRGPGDEVGRLDPRSPLVLPPDPTLVSPEPERTDTALLSPQWPDDPDVRAAREREELRQLREERGKQDNRTLARTIGQSQPLSREELLAGATERDPNYSSAEEVVSRQETATAASPEELLGRTTATTNAGVAPGPPREGEQNSSGIRTAQTEEPTSSELRVPPGINSAPPIGDAPADPKRERRRNFWRRILPIPD